MAIALVGAGPARDVSRPCHTSRSSVRVQCPIGESPDIAGLKPRVSEPSGAFHAAGPAFPMGDRQGIAPGVFPQIDEIDDFKDEVQHCGFESTIAMRSGSCGQSDRTGTPSPALKTSAVACRWARPAGDQGGCGAHEDERDRLFRPGPSRATRPASRLRQHAFETSVCMRRTAMIAPWSCRSAQGCRSRTRRAPHSTPPSAPSLSGRGRIHCARSGSASWLSPATGGDRPDRRGSGGLVSGKTRQDRAHPRSLRPTRSPLHARGLVGYSISRCRRHGQAATARGQGAQPGQPAVGPPGPRPFPGRAAARPDRGADAGSVRQGRKRGLSYWKETIAA
jgi:hypothetical protein